MSSVAGECGVGGWLVHKVCWSRLRVSLERFLFLVARWFYFPTALTPIRTCDRSRSSNLINAISGRGSPDPGGQARDCCVHSSRSLKDSAQQVRWAHRQDAYVPLRDGAASRYSSALS